jgi:hypothetical protein
MARLVAQWRASGASQGGIRAPASDPDVDVLVLVPQTIDRCAADGRLVGGAHVRARAARGGPAGGRSCSAGASACSFGPARRRTWSGPRCQRSARRADDLAGRPHLSGDGATDLRRSSTACPRWCASDSRWTRSPATCSCFGIGAGIDSRCSPGIGRASGCSISGSSAARSPGRPSPRPRRSKWGAPIGHFRYWLEAVGPERQHIVTDNNEERPFSRDQRRWIYASAKPENNYFGFGSDNEMELSYLIVKHQTFPLENLHPGDPQFDPQDRVP